MKLPLTPSYGVSLLALMLATAEPYAVLANPTGGSVAEGNASISSLGSTLTVTQATDKAIINWQGFDIASGETTSFKQPSKNSITLNRVNSANPSFIDGNLDANGNIVILNQNGVLFGKGSQVNVNSLLATTADIDNAKFMAGDMTFDKPGNPNATVENQGTITAKQAGLVGLVAPNVLNSGTINAKLGRIGMASGDTVTVDFYGDGLLEVQASPALQKQVVSNTGKLNAQGGTIAMTAAAARETVKSLINVDGQLNANAVGTKNGNIFIYAAGSNAVPDDVVADTGAKNGASTVVVTGKLTASSRKGKGGTIIVTGDKVTLASTAKLSANGATGGGTVNVGGQAHGEDPTPTALTTDVEQGAVIEADATKNGNGGNVTVWSDGATSFGGTILARGGAQGGNGGMVETSGAAVNFDSGNVNTLAVQGRAGNWLIDPTDLIIDATAASAIATNLATTGVALQTTASGAPTVTGVTVTAGEQNTSGSGNIYINSAISWNAATTLTLNAYNALHINAPITVGGNGGVVLTYNTASATNLSFGSGDNIGYSGAGSYSSQSLSINGTSYKLVYTMSQLDAIDGINGVTGGALTTYGAGLSGYYALATPLNAGGTTYTEAVVAPGTSMTGTFEGLGNTVSNLIISATNQGSVGLFGSIGSGGALRDVGLVGATVTNTSTSGANVGALVGYSGGTLTGDYATGSLTANYTGGSTTNITNAGGLVGESSGTISSSYAAVGVSGNSAAWDWVGGFVGYAPGGIITQSYATGNVYAISGTNAWAGGLVGNNASTLSQSYSTGAVNGSASLGGFVGYGNNIAVTNSYWDKTTSGQSSMGTAVTGVTGYTTAQLQSNSASYMSSLGSAFGGGTGGLYPYLLWQAPTGTPQAVSGIAYSDQGVTALVGATVVGLNNGATLNSLQTGGAVTTGANGYYYILLAPGTISSGSEVLTYLTGATKGNSLYDGASGSVSGLNIYGNSLNLFSAINTPASLAGGLATAMGSNSGSNFLGTGSTSGNIDSIATSNGNIDLFSNVSWSSATPFVLSAAGAVYINSGVTISNTYSGTFANTTTGNAVPVVLALRADNANANGYATAAGSSYGIVNNGTLNLSGSSGGVSIFYDWNGTYTAGTQSANGSWAAPANASISSQFTGYRLVNSVADLTSIGNNSTTLGYTYALGTNINGGGAAFNSNAALGTLTGTLDGQYGALLGGSDYGITNFTMTSNSGTSIASGLFGGIGSTGIVRNLQVGVAISATYSGTSNALIGTLAGNSFGVVANVAALGGSVTYVSTVSGTSTSNPAIGGLIGYASGSGVILNSSSADNVTFTYSGSSSATFNVDIGGLLGKSFSSATFLSNSTASGQVLAQSSGCSGNCNVGGNVGGLVGNISLGSLTASYATGNSTNNLSGGGEYIGGLVGLMANSTAAISNSYYTTGTLSYGGISAFSMGGLVGYNAVGTIGGTGGSYSYATVPVSYSGAAAGNIGGLVGNNNGTITQAYATGSVSGTTSNSSGMNIGGLVGNNSGAISSAYTSIGTVTGTNTTSGSTTSALFIGGLVGVNNSGTVTGSTSSENVNYVYSGSSSAASTGFTGGLIGANVSTATVSVSGSSAGGAVTATTSGCTSNCFAQAWIGGLIGENGTNNAVAITTSFATGAISDSLSGGTQRIGGLVGKNSTTGTGIANSYATGTVTYLGTDGAAPIGGLVGWSQNGTILDSYAIGDVKIGSVASGYYGGLVGFTGGTVTTSYYDAGTTGQSTSPGGGTSQTTAQLQGTLPTGFSSSIWGITAGGYPYLLGQLTPGTLTGLSGTPQIVSGTAYSDNGVTAIAGGNVGVLVNGSSAASLLGSTASTGANGYYYFLLSPGTLAGTGSEALTYLTGTTKGNTLDDGASGTITGLNIWGNTLRLISATGTPASIASGLATALGSNSGSNFLGTGSASGGVDTIATTSGSIYLTSALTTAGSDSLTLSAAQDISIGGAITLNGGALTLRSNNTASGAGAVNVAANVTTNGGNITIGGGSGAITAGSGYAVGDANFGCGVTISNALNAGAGGIIINGKSFTSSITNYYGVFVNAGTITTSESSALTVNGIGQGTGSTSSSGVWISGGTLQATGLLGSLSLTGTGGYGTGGLNGGVVLTSSSVVSTINGLLTVVGTGGGSGTSSGDGGVITGSVGSNTLKTTGTGTLSVTGIGGVGSGGTENGIWAKSANGIETTGGGTLILSGVAGTGGLGIYASTSNAYTTTGTGSIVVYADTLSLSAAGAINSAGSLTVAPHTHGSSVGIGPTSGSNVNISDAVIADMSAISYVFGAVMAGDGSAATGTMTINTGHSFSGMTVSFVSGGTMSLAGSLVAGTLNLTDASTVTQSAAITAANLSLSGSGATYSLTNSGNIIGTMAASVGAGTVSLNNGENSLTIGAVNSINGVTAGTLNLTDTGAVTQTQALMLTSLSLSGAGGAYTLTNSSNNVGTVAGSTGSVNFSNGNNSFTVGTVNGIAGLTTTGNDALTAGTGTLTTVAAIASGSGNVTLTADAMALGANLTGTGTLTAQPYSASRLVDINGSSGDPVGKN